MILTTHFLDEVDVLAGHIVIICFGHLECEGSAVELQVRLDGGYKVHLAGTIRGPEMNLPAKRL
jgi:ABC-type multidrug transport system ATPase subunit